MTTDDLFAGHATKPAPAEVRAAVRAYANAVGSCDAASVARLFDEDGTIADPVGSPVWVGRSEVQRMFASIFEPMSDGASLDFRVDGHISVAGHVAVVPLRVDWKGARRTKRIRAIDVI